MVENDFFETFSDLKTLSVFKDLIKRKGKTKASSIMWGLYLVYNPNSNIWNMLMEDRKKEVLDNVIKDKSFTFESEEELINYYKETIITPIERSYNNLRKKLEERDAVLSELSYDINTYEDIDKMILNSDKLLGALDKIHKEFLSSNSGGKVTGDLAESASEMGLI